MPITSGSEKSAHAKLTRNTQMRGNEKIKENEVLLAKFSEKLKIGKFFSFKFLFFE
jgi:hypothetical protein